MKKILTLVVIALFLFTNKNVNSQTIHPFELGFNVGASWLKSDVKMKKLGLGGGFTFGQMYGENATNLIDWGWRFRYLGASTYGQDTKSSTGIMNNNALNGILGGDSLNYYSNGGIVYHNYKTKISECSIELLFGANRLRERTHVYPYIFGGLGLIKAATTMDQLDAKGVRYNYKLIDSTDASVNDFLDGDYESKADGNQNPTWKFMPSVGVGLGFEVVKGFSIGVEHKMTWGLNDVLDGQQWSNTNAATGNNDMYHYSSVWLKFSFGRGHKITPTTTTTTDATNYTTTVNNKPTIVFTNPGSGSASVSQQAFTVKAKITNVNSISDIIFSGNGNAITNFTYNSSTDVFTCPVTLTNGANNYVVTATNTAGSENGTATVVYTPAPIVVPSPVITIVSPNVNPYTTNQPAGGVIGMVQGINSQSDMHVTINGANTTNFVYNPASKGFSINYNLVLGANTFVVSANNAGGSDSKSIVINLQSDASSFSSPAPVITITNPTVNPYNSNMNATSVIASVLNVNSGNQIAVTLNGSNAPFNFNAATHQITLSVSLILGANTVMISATNTNGGDSKTETIIYTPIVSPKPVITITNPGTNPYNINVNSAVVNATILNITAIGQISVLLNGGPIPTAALNFNPSTHQLTFNLNLIVGANTILVSATNVSGSDSKTETIIYTSPVVLPKPVITITSPGTNPFTTNTSPTSLVASVLNVIAASQISIMLNGTNAPFNFNPASHQLTMNSNLIVGTNLIMITATNPQGSDSKTQTIIYTVPPPVLPPVVTFISPSVNPFVYNQLTYTIKTTILNITTASQIKFYQNNVLNTGFSFVPATKQLIFNATLNLGANLFKVVATNIAGKDSATMVIKVAATAPTNTPDTIATLGNPNHGEGGENLPTHAIQHELTTSPDAPAITLLNPIMNTVTTTNMLFNVSMTVDVPVSSAIVVKIDGVVTTLFSFDTATKQLLVPVTLHRGENNVTVEATNSSGTRTQIVTIQKKS